MDDLGRDLSDALERAERESKRNRFLSDLGNSIEFDELLDRVLDAALEVPGFDAAMVALDEARRAADDGDARDDARGGGAPAVVRSGRSTSGRTDHRQLPLRRRRRGRHAADPRRALRAARQPGRDHARQPRALLAHARLRADAASGSARSSRSPETCIPAIENARRYREARQLAETDALTGFFNQRYFHETLRREALRAQRYDRRLALLILDLDDFKAVNDRIGHLAGDAVLAQVAERLRNEIRSVDIGCRVGGDEFAVIMPESTTDDAAQLFQRMHEASSSMSVPGGSRVRISAGIAELRHGETAAGLFERADSALYRAKELGKDRASLAKE